MNISTTWLDAPLWLAVALWYTLGILSIATSKLLLNEATSPILLTLQQLLIGSTLLRILLRFRFLSNGYQDVTATDSLIRRICEVVKAGTSAAKAQELLALAGMCFSVGFLATNLAFSGSDVSFVETIKAAEPLTSAAVATIYKIETLNTPQMASLMTIVVGVLLSTLGHHSATESTSPTKTVLSCGTVIAANLCFSFRGLFQKLFRRHDDALEDLNLQFHMQRMGAVVVAILWVVFSAIPALLQRTLNIAHARVATEIIDAADETARASPLHYVLLAILNGFAFTSYNLASTFILSRISVVHHAALNCIRRVFAIVLTSLMFNVSISIEGALGIALAIAGFLSYTHFKAQSSLQKHGSQGDLLLTETAPEEVAQK